MMKQANMNRIRGCAAALGAVVVLAIAGCGGCRETSGTLPTDTWADYVPGGSTDTDDSSEIAVPTEPPSSDREPTSELEPDTGSTPSETESETETKTDGIIEGGIKLATPRGDLYYSTAWEDVLTAPKQSQEGDCWVVSFGVTLGGTEYPLFDIVIGEDDAQGLGQYIGQMTDGRGVTCVVYVRIPSEEEMPTRTNMYWAQYCAAKEEQINFIRDHLA